jgi:hypothetical protein
MAELLRPGMDLTPDPFWARVEQALGAEANREDGGT